MEEGLRTPFARRGVVPGRVGGVKGGKGVDGDGLQFVGANVCGGKEGGGGEGVGAGGWRRGCEEALEIGDDVCDFETVHVVDAHFNETLLRHLERLNFSKVL
jgi:hypothetical protein